MNVRIILPRQFCKVCHVRRAVRSATTCHNPVTFVTVEFRYDFVRFVGRSSAAEHTARESEVYSGCVPLKYWFVKWDRIFKVITVITKWHSSLQDCLVGRQANNCIAHVETNSKFVFCDVNL